MVEQNNNLKSKFKGRSTKKSEQSGSWLGVGGTEKQNDFFSIERSNRYVRRFRLFFRDGKIISIPYAYLPIIIFDPDRSLLIKTSELEITIKGRALKILADHLSEEKVLWIKESSSGVDNQDSEVFISGIEIEGDLIE